MKKSDTQSFARNNPFGRFISQNSMILSALIIMGIVLSLISSSFFSSANLLSVLRQASTNAILSMSMAMVLIIGCIDLSISSSLALSGALCVIMINNGVSIYLALIVTLAFGAFCGLLNGAMAAFTDIPPFIITLATQQCFRGAAYLLTDGRTIMCYDETFTQIGAGSFWGIPIPVIIVLIVFIIAAIILGKSKFGRRMYAIGGNKAAAIYSGIKVRKVTVIVYVLTGILASLAGIVLSSRTYSCQPTAGTGYECDAIAAAVLGGVSFNGGIGTAGGVMLGALVIAFLNNGLNMLHVHAYWQTIAKGIVILIAVFFDTIKVEKMRK